MQITSLPRAAQRLLPAALLAAGAVLGLQLVASEPVRAEFEIQEAGVEKGEVEFDYRGAYHWGLPTVNGGGDVLNSEEGDQVEGDSGDVPLRQSHDFEFEMGITDRWMLAATLITSVPAGFDWQADAVEIENQYEFIERHGDGLGLAFSVAYGRATQPESANELEFGPIIELAAGKLLFTSNTFFTKEYGEFAETNGIGFDYGWRTEYDFSRHWGVGVEMFGTIEDLSNPGSFNDQEHSIGPTIFFKPGGDDGDEAVGNVGEDDENEAGPKTPKMEFSMNVGVQFGLTDATSDTALKFQGTLGF